MRQPFESKLMAAWERLSSSETHPPEIWVETWQARIKAGLRWFFHIKTKGNFEVLCSGDPSGYHNEADMLDTVVKLQFGMKNSTAMRLRRPPWKKKTSRRK